MFGKVEVFSIGSPVFDALFANYLVNHNGIIAYNLFHCAFQSSPIMIMSSVEMLLANEVLSRTSRTYLYPII